MGSASPPHVVVFPTMAQGHTLPLLDLSSALCRRDLKITIITTPLNVPYIASKVSENPQISLHVLPFPQAGGLPEGCENTAHLPSEDLIPTFLRATKALKEPFEDVLRDMCESGSIPICVISDFFLWWTLDSCRLFGIPRLVSNGMGVLPVVIGKAASSYELAALSDSDSIKLPQVKVPFNLVRADLPDSLLEGSVKDAWRQFMADVGEADAESWGFVFNSFEELEGEYVAALESSFRKKANAWCVGPLLLANQIATDHCRDQPCRYIKWLNNQSGPNAAIYVSFGTQAHVSEAQMDEIAMGLEMAGYPFIWVVRSTKWTPPDGWEERVKDKGLVARDWVEQRSILAHPSTGGFLSHCGWNSVLESLCGGVPLLAWPLGAEQRLNAKYVKEGLGAGMLVPQGIKIVGRDAIYDGVKELMGGEGGRKARERAQELGVMARQAVEKGGSSDRKLEELIECLIHRKKDV